MDASGSIGRESFQKEIDFVKAIVYGMNLEGDTRVGMVTFSNQAVLRFKLNEYSSKLDVLGALSFYYEGGTTNTAGALRTLRRDMFTRSGGDRDQTPNIGTHPDTI